EEAKIGDDLGIQQTHSVGRHRVSEPWAKLFRDRRAAYYRSSLEDLDFQARHAEVGGASQPIVPATNNNDVVCLHRRRELQQQGRGSECLIYCLAPSRLAGILARTDRFTSSLASVVTLES